LAAIRFDLNRPVLGLWYGPEWNLHVGPSQQCHATEGTGRRRLMETHPFKFPWKLALPRHDPRSRTSSSTMLRSAVSRRSSQLRRLLSSSAAAAGGTPVPGPCIVHKRGNDILNDPWYNKVGRRASSAPCSNAISAHRVPMSAGHGFPADGARQARPPRPAPAAGHDLQGAVRAFQ
jgi:hypothetical protein